MAFNRDSLHVLKEKNYAHYLSLFKPMDRVPRHSLVSVMANVDAGLAHLLQGDLVFLSKQLFPDTAEGEYLRAHWSYLVPPLYAIAAIGKVEVGGMAGKPIPAGVVFKSPAGQRYFSEKAYKIPDGGNALVDVRAEKAGLESNLAAGSPLAIVSAIPSGINSDAVVCETGILGGVDAESDEEYLARVLAALRNPVRYGKKDDYAAWAIDSSPEVSSAWEYKNFGVFGALLIQVINGNQQSGVHQVANLAAVRDYINSVAPPVVFDVRTPFIVPINPTIILPPQEDTLENRDLAETRLKAYLQHTARPGIALAAGALRLAIIDGVKISGSTVKLKGDTAGIIQTTILEYPVLGEIAWG
jgi:uncharacterized phage protein gp47/JayE